MTNRPALVTIIGAFLTSAQHAYAGDMVVMDGAELYAQCLKQTAICALYVRDFAEGSKAIRLYCPPPTGLTPSQEQDIVVQYLFSKPTYLFVSAGLAAFTALATVYPCRSGG
jgi:hypothetical protein